MIKKAILWDWWAGQSSQGVEPFDIAENVDFYIESQYMQDFSDSNITAAGSNIKRFIDQVNAVNPVHSGSSSSIFWGYDDGSGNNCAQAVDVPGFDMVGAHFPNSRDCEYTTPAFTAESHPLTLILVFYKLDGLDGENTDKGANALNFRDKSDSANIRIGLSTTELIELSVNTGMVSNALNIIEIEYNNDASNVKINRVKLGSDINLNDALTITNHILGSTTNCTPHIKFFHNAIYSLASDTLKDSIYGEYTRRGYTHGKVVSAPYADNVDFDQSTVPTDALMKVTWDKNLYASSAIVSTQVLWVYSGDGSAPDLASQTLLVTQNLGDVSTATINLNDYTVLNTDGSPIANGSGVWINAWIKLTDANGATFIHTSATDWKRDNIARFLPTVTMDIGFRQDARATPTTDETAINDISVSTSETINNALDIDGNALSGITIDATDSNLIGQSDSGGTLASDTTTFNFETVNTFAYADKAIGTAVIFINGVSAKGWTINSIIFTASTNVGNANNRDTRLHAGGNDGLDASVDYDAYQNSTEYTISAPALDASGNLRIVLEGIGSAGSNNRGLIGAMRIVFNT